MKHPFQIECHYLLRSYIHAGEPIRLRRLLQLIGVGNVCAVLWRISLVVWGILEDVQHYKGIPFSTMEEYNHQYCGGCLAIEVYH